MDPKKDNRPFIIEGHNSNYALELLQERREGVSGGKLDECIDSLVRYATEHWGRSVDEVCKLATIIPMAPDFYRVRILDNEPRGYSVHRESDNKQTEAILDAYTDHCNAALNLDTTKGFLAPWGVNWFIFTYTAFAKLFRASGLDTGEEERDADGKPIRAPEKAYLDVLRKYSPNVTGNDIIGLIDRRDETQDFLVEIAYEHLERSVRNRVHVELDIAEMLFKF